MGQARGLLSLLLVSDLPGGTYLGWCRAKGRGKLHVQNVPRQYGYGTWYSIEESHDKLFFFFPLLHPVNSLDYLTHQGNAKNVPLHSLMNWFNCLPNLRAAKTNKLKFTILWSHLQGDNTETVYFVRCLSEQRENYSHYIIIKKNYF